MRARGRIVSRIVGGFGWAVIGLGGLIFLLSLGHIRSAYGILDLTRGVAVIVAGLVLVCLGEVVRAVQATAAETAEIAALLRGQQGDEARPPPQ